MLTRAWPTLRSSSLLRLPTSTAVSAPSTWPAPSLSTGFKPFRPLSTNFGATETKSRKAKAVDAPQSRPTTSRRTKPKGAEATRGPKVAAASEATAPGQTTAQSSVARGTAFEHLCASVLNSLFGMQLERCGGAGDKGIDLKGWWTLPAVGRSGRSSSPGSGVATSGMPRIRVIVQCKCQDWESRKKLGPVIVREVEGVLHRAHARHDGRPPTASEVAADPTQTTRTGAGLGDGDGPTRTPVVGVLVSSSGFSKQALLQARSSLFPMMLVQVQQLGPADVEVSQGGDAGMTKAADRCRALVWNDPLAGPRGILRGRMELLWERTLDGSRSDRAVVLFEGARLSHGQPGGNAR